MEACIRMLYDKNVLPKHKGESYKIVVRLTLLYGAKCWKIKNFHIQKMQVAEEY